MAAKRALLVRCDCPTLLGACQVALAVLCTVLVPTIQERCGQLGEGLKKGHKDDQGVGERAP